MDFRRIIRKCQSSTDAPRAAPEESTVVYEMGSKIYFGILTNSQDPDSDFMRLWAAFNKDASARAECPVERELDVLILTYIT